jgi:exosortase/archaeosortase family protein
MNKTQTDKLFYILKSNKYFVYKSIMVFVVLFSLLLGGWSYIAQTHFYHVFIENYSFVSGELSVCLSRFFSHPIVYNSDQNTLCWVNNTILQVIPGNLFLLIFSLIIILFVYSGNWLNNIGFLLLFTLFFLFRSALINITFLYFKGTNYAILVDVLDSLRYLPALFVLSYLIRKNSYFNSTNKYVNGLLSENLIISLEKILYILVLISPLPRIIIALVSDFILGVWANWTLLISLRILSLFDYHTTVIDNVIHWGHNWILLGEGCLGIGMLSVIFILIFSTRSNTRNKISFFFLTIPLYTFLNSLRIILLLFYFNKGWSDRLTAQEMHDNANVLFYLIGFILFLIYYLWFLDLKLDFRHSKDKRIVKK